MMRMLCLGLDGSTDDMSLVQVDIHKTMQMMMMMMIIIIIFIACAVVWRK